MMTSGTKLSCKFHALAFMKTASFLLKFFTGFLPRITTPSVYLVMLFFLFGSLNKTKAQKPNIILILSDDIGYKTLAVNGAIVIIRVHCW